MWRGAQVAYGGQWTPATSNSFSQMALLQLRAISDDYQEPLSSSLQNATVDSATLLGPANRRLLQQVGLPHSCSRPCAVCRDVSHAHDCSRCRPLPAGSPAVSLMCQASALWPSAERLERCLEMREGHASCAE